MAKRRFGIEPLPPGLTFWHPTSMIGTWFGLGLLRPAPGTLGALGALPFAWIVMSAGGWTYLLAATVAMTILGIRVSTDYARLSDGDDPQSVVVDEVVGVWIALLAAPLTMSGFLVAFVTFRFYDILKPWPVSWADSKLKSGLGVMMDDVFAGIYALIVVYLCRVWGLLG